MRPSAFASLKPQILDLRQQGLSYSQIQESLGIKIPQSTLSNWCSGISLSPEAQAELRKRMSGDPYRLAIVSLLAKERRQARREVVKGNNLHLRNLIQDKEVAKIALAMLYLGEGAKNEKGTVQFGNSNPEILALFLSLFTTVYETEVSKFRARIQCRADQDHGALEKFWASVISIHGIRFYPTWSDPRTIGKPTKKEGYKGVCCISYFDNRIQFELVNLGKLLCPAIEGP